MEQKVKSYEELEAYKNCRVFRIFVFENIISILLNQKEFSLADQLKRASRSITANIAEGYGRFHYKDNSKFCIIARGSLNESLEHGITANDESLISKDLLIQLHQLFESAIKPLNGYISYLQRQANISK